MSLSLTASFLRRVLPLAVLGCVVGLGLPVTSVQGDVATGIFEKKKKDKEPEDKKDRKFDFLPEAKDLTVKFIAGHAAQVELIASVGSLRQVEFIIRQGPQHGALTPPRPHPRESNRAVLTYSHRDPAGELSDSFIYACRVDGGPWSAPARVTLVGQRMEPKIEVLGNPQFGRIFLGSEVSTRVSLKNTGSADLNMEVAWPAPFKGPPVIQVPKAGGVTELLVSFRPDKPGEFRHELVLHPGNPAVTLFFHGECVQPFSVSPGNLELVLDRASGERSGVISLVNARPEAVRVEFRSPARLTAPQQTEVAGSSRSDVRLVLPAGDVAAFNGELLVSTGSDVRSVAITAKAKPAEMRLVVPASNLLDFGSVEQRTSSGREVILHNPGGEELAVEARARPPFSVGSAVHVLRIPPRSEGSLRVYIQADQTGPVSGQLQLKSAAESHTIPLKAMVREAKAPPPEPPPVPAAPPQNTVAKAPAQPASPPPAPPVVTDKEAGKIMRNALQAAIMTYVATNGVPLPKQRVNPYLESPVNLEVRSASPREVVIAWKKPSLMPSGWLIEFSAQVQDRQTGLIAKLWQPHTQWVPADAGPDRVAARLQALTPGAQYELRIMAVDRDGKLSEPSRPLLIGTDAPWRLPEWTWRVLIAGALALVGYTLFRVRRGDFDLATA